MTFKSLLICCLFLLSQQAIAQDEEYISISEISLPNGDVDLYVVNSAPIPVTVTLDFPKIQNYTPAESLPMVKVLKKGTEKQFLIKLKRGNPYKDATYGYSFAYGLGDELTVKHNDKQVYLLPFESGKSYLVSQGFNGRFSHKGVNATDFQMQEGTKICAARAGTVASIKANSRRGCKSAACKGQANNILIYHEDGTFGYYGHLQHDGVMVVPGQEVKAGQVIGRSGNTGWSSGPHLHFEVHYIKNRRQYTLPIKYLTGQGRKEAPKRGATYKAFHPTRR